MTTNHLIDELIRREKEMLPDPLLTSRVMTRMKSAAIEEKRAVPLWQAIAVAGSIAAAAFLGNFIGSNSVDCETSAKRININDRQIENLGYYYFGEDE
ncbi:MAG: hypothetical protein PHS71_10110 [Proteiniphilum sp.]|nr:hypothetical protein [Proteiniphilum sp.]